MKCGYTHAWNVDKSSMIHCDCQFPMHETFMNHVWSSMIHEWSMYNVCFLWCVGPQFPMRKTRLTATVKACHMFISFDADVAEEGNGCGMPRCITSRRIYLDTLLQFLAAANAINALAENLTSRRHKPLARVTIISLDLLSLQKKRFSFTGHLASVVFHLYWQAYQPIRTVFWFEKILALYEHILLADYVISKRTPTFLASSAGMIYSQYFSHKQGRDLYDIFALVFVFPETHLCRRSAALV